MQVDYRKIVSAVIIILVLAFLAIIYYQNYQKNQQLLPNQSIPAAKVPVVYKSPLHPPADLTWQQGPFTCPFASMLCRDPKNFYPDKLAVTTKTNLYAAFDGQLDVLKSTHPGNPANNSSDQKEEYTTAILTNLKRGLQAMYYFKDVKADEAKPTKFVKEGALIASASGQPIKSEGNFTAIFQLIKAQTEGQPIASLSARDFKK